MDNLSYWKDLSSTGLRALQKQGNVDAVSVIKRGILGIEFNNHDNWDGGIDYWDIVFQLKYRDFMALGDRKDAIEGDILNVLGQFHTDERDQIANVMIKPIVERFIDWRAILPETKESTIQLIEEEKDILTAIATGKSYKDDGVEEGHQKRHRYICFLASTAGFEYPVTCNSLAEWWLQIRDVGGYAERRVYISQMIAPVLNLLRESDDSDEVNFSRIATRSGTVHKAIEDAYIFIREGKYDSAVDRVHTAFHGYLRQMLTEHGASFGPDDSLPALYSKLHTFYEGNMQPVDVGERVKTILRSAGGMINAVNELRNNNTVAHPNGQLIQEREAQLVIRLINAVVDYIEDVEESLQ